MPCFLSPLGLLHIFQSQPEEHLLDEAFPGHLLGLTAHPHNARQSLTPATPGYDCGHVSLPLGSEYLLKVGAVSE